MCSVGWQWVAGVGVRPADGLMAGAWYDKHADEYAAQTVDAPLGELRRTFTQWVGPPPATLLDLGPRPDASGG